uniref:Uncharacterized protein n=1 Tax=Denticeps clupeoides TaxID=299321 RepID=A0AAY4A897_9TELE
MIMSCPQSEFPQVSVCTCWVDSHISVSSCSVQRKSLRDQWLMEGPPISPDASGPRSPLWSLQAQDMEKQIENIAKQHSDWQRVIITFGGVILFFCTDNQEPIVQNGHVKSTHQSTEPNGEEAETGAVTSSAVRANGVVQQPLAQDTPPTTNGPTGEVLPGGITLTFLGFSEVGPGESTSVDEEGGAIMRAERVVIADEVEDDIEEDTPGSLMEEFTLDVAESNSPSKTQEEHAESVEKSRRSPGPPEARRSPGPPKAKVSSPAESVELVKEEPKSSALPQGPPIPGRFHEIPLDGSRSEPRVEEEPLLVSKVSPLTNDESRVEAVGAPKRKTCQCCSVM